MYLLGSVTPSNLHFHHFFMVPVHWVTVAFLGFSLFFPFGVSFFTVYNIGLLDVLYDCIDCMNELMRL